MWRCFRYPTNCGDVESTILFEDHFVVALPSTHPLAKRAQLDSESLWEENVLLLKDGHCLREHALAACRLSDRRRTEGFEATSLATLVKLVDNGFGVTLLPTLAVEAGLLNGTRVVTRPLSGHAPTRQIGLIWRRKTGRGISLACERIFTRGSVRCLTCRIISFWTACTEKSGVVRLRG
jgi:LysR family transcriptional regulator, hydrogen peroxide-inducible genes activator